MPGRIATFATVLILGFLLAACGGDDEGTTDTTPSAGSGGPAEPAAFVGELDIPRSASPDPLIGVEAADGRVQAFICDGRGIWGWFDGPRAGTDVDLTARGSTGDGRVQPRRLLLVLASGSARGELILADGSTVPVRLRPASGTDGLYQAESVGGDGRVHAETATGNNLDGIVTASGSFTAALTAAVSASKVTGQFEDSFRLTEASAHDGLRDLVVGERAAGMTVKPGGGFTKTGSDL